MHLAFVDESISDGHFYLGAIVVTPKQVSEIATGIDELMKMVSQLSNGNIDPTQEIKGKELWQGRGIWGDEPFGERLRYSIIANLMNVVLQKQPLIHIQSIDSNKLNQRYSLPKPPYELGFKFLLEQIDRQFESLNSYGLIISDNLGSISEHRKQRDKLAEYKRFGTRGNYPRRLNQIVDTIYYSDSKDSRLIQAIDVITYLIRRHEMSRAPQSNEKLFLETQYQNINNYISKNRK